ncbi:hypothetical protein [Microvirga sp. 17 mud 1-3]|uniref:ParB/RepB/Spo0J family partition protein n=1 Tax=Microvirga sp. 17 mud 1-3 TaxID=2082949 RepID=UPI000D6B71D4|nr:hypothetical protein [Microvirga sp. 17 mud 1-3]AWM87348.1 hypothetical protein C4E04_11790 [Microvirga sp. 17 mud 1-3]
MTTFKQKILSGEIKRADAMKVRYEDLHVEPGFNLRADIESLRGQAREEAEAAEENLFRHIMAGGQYPALEVRPRAEGGVWIVDGHRRHRNIGRAIAAGAPLQDKDGVVWVRVEAFSGNDADRVARVITSQENRKLAPLEIAEGYKRLSAFGWDNDRIAKTVGKTPQHVAQLLILANANSDVHRLVAEGTVSAAMAVEMVRKHGDEAGQVLAGEADKAKAQGKRKVTAGTIKGKPLPRVVVDRTVDALEGLAESLGADARADLAYVEAHADDAAAREKTISVPAWALLDLLAQHQEIIDAKAAEAQRVRDAQAKAAQQEIPQANDNQPMENAA